MFLRYVKKCVYFNIGYFGIEVFVRIDDYKFWFCNIFFNFKFLLVYI